MARQDSRGILISDGVTEDKLAELYSEIIDMIQKKAISVQLKNTDYSGNPQSGSVEVRRMATSVSQTLGTARTAGEGDKLQNNGVTIKIDTDKEIVEEVAQKDIKLYGLADIMTKRSKNHDLAMIRELDTAFFAQAVSAGASVDVSGESTVTDKLELLIQSVETVSNENVDGVDREMIAVTVTPAIYGELRNYIDSLPNPVEGGVDIKTFHGVEIYSNVRQSVDAIAQAKGSIGQPVTADVYATEKIPLSNDWAVELFYSFGTKAVMADLIFYADFSAVSA